MLTQRCLPPPLTSTVKSLLFTVLNNVHSSLLSLASRWHQCCANHSYYMNNGWTCNFIVVRILFNSISGGSEWCLFYNLVIRLMWLCEESSCVYLCHHLHLKSTTLLSMCCVFLFNPQVALPFLGHFSTLVDLAREVDCRLTTGYLAAPQLWFREQDPLS